MRALNVAREIRLLAPRAAVTLHARNPSTGLFCAPGVRWVLDSQPGCDWAATVRATDPDVVVYDTLIPDAAELERLPPDVKIAYVMRRSSDERHAAILRSGFLDRVDVVVVPHDREEFDRPLPPSLHRRAVFTGPVVRSPEPGRVEVLRRRYLVETAHHVVVSCAGGGGFEETAEPFFDAVWNAHDRLARTVPRLRHIVVLGPHHRGSRPQLHGMRVVRSEPNLVDLFALADVVVSEGGYNSVHEIRHVGVPGCFVPGSRRWDDQAQRVRALAERGLAAVVEPAEPEVMGAQIAAVAGSRSRLSALRHRTRQVPLIPGNRCAAAAILATVS